MQSNAPKNTSETIFCRSFRRFNYKHTLTNEVPEIIKQKVIDLKELYDKKIPKRI